MLNVTARLGGRVIYDMSFPEQVEMQCKCFVSKERAHRVEGVQKQVHWATQRNDAYLHSSAQNNVDYSGTSYFFQQEAIIKVPPKISFLAVCGNGKSDSLGNWLMLKSLLQ